MPTTAAAAGRTEPYTQSGIRRVMCFRCENRAEYQWQVCADKGRYRPLCARCDVELNAIVLRWMNDPQAEQKIAEYRKVA